MKHKNLLNQSNLTNQLVHIKNESIYAHNYIEIKHFNKHSTLALAVQVNLALQATRNALLD